MIASSFGALSAYGAGALGSEEGLLDLPGGSSGAALVTDFAEGARGEEGGVVPANKKVVLSCEVRPVVAGCRYGVRIFAVNAVGYGQPSEDSEKVYC